MNKHQNLRGLIDSGLFLTHMTSSVGLEALRNSGCFQLNGLPSCPAVSVATTMLRPQNVWGRPAGFSVPSLGSEISFSEVSRTIPSNPKGAGRVSVGQHCQPLPQLSVYVC